MRKLPENAVFAHCDLFYSTYLSVILLYFLTNQTSIIMQMTTPFQPLQTLLRNLLKLYNLNQKLQSNGLMTMK